MNHFTPFIPARMSLTDIAARDDSRRDIEQRMLEAARLPRKIQRVAVPLALLAVSFGLTFAAALQVVS